MVAQVAVFLLLGAAVNIAVAWGCDQLPATTPWLDDRQSGFGTERSYLPFTEYSKVMTTNLGWPRRSIHIDRWNDLSDIRNLDSLEPHESWRLLWPGFAINTVFYAGVCWLLVAAPFAIRRRRRVKRGLCPACAYPIGANDLCTECGKPVTTTAGSRN